MNTKKNFNLGLILGILGAIAGILLLFMGNYLIGIFGSIASAGLAWQSYNSHKK